MTAEDILREISQKATGMVNRGETPRIVRLGHTQIATLEQTGRLGDALAAAAPIIAPQIFTLPGEDNPASTLGHVSLRIERTSDESRLEVA